MTSVDEQAVLRPRSDAAESQLSRRRRQHWEARTGVIMALPVIIGLAVFMIGPMVASLVISFTDWQIGTDAKFVGLGNYSFLVGGDPLFWKSLWVTLYYTLCAVPLVLVVGFAVALLLNTKVKGQGLFRTAFYLPSLVPIVVSAVLWNWMFNPDFGLFNEILKSVGLPTSLWTFDERTVVPSLVIMAMWGFGNIMVIFLAGLQDVPTHLYEAIALDGGNRWHAFRNITLPLMTPIIFYNLITSLIASIQTFEQAYVMTHGGPNNGSLFIVYYLYRTAFTNGMMGIRPPWPGLCSSSSASSRCCCSGGHAAGSTTAWEAHDEGECSPAAEESRGDLRPPRPGSHPHPPATGVAPPQLGDGRRADLLEPTRVDP